MCLSVSLIQSDLLLDLIKKVTEDSALPANLLTTVRVLVNLFKNSSFHYWLQSHHSQVSTISFPLFYIMLTFCDDLDEPIIGLASDSQPVRRNFLFLCLLSVAELCLEIEMKLQITFDYSAYTCVFVCFVMII